MGNSITFDEISQQLCSINRVTLCCFQNGIQYDSPYLVQYGQLERVIGNPCKEPHQRLHTLQNSSLYISCHTASLPK